MGPTGDRFNAKNICVFSKHLKNYQGIFLFNEAESFMIESASRWTRGRSLSSVELGSLSLSSLTMSPEYNIEQKKKTA